VARGAVVIKQNSLVFWRWVYMVTSHLGLKKKRKLQSYFITSVECWEHILR